MTILIIDDHLSLRVQARALLEADGFTVVGSQSERESSLPRISPSHGA